MQTIDEMRAHVLGKAAKNDEFRSALLTDTKQVLEDEFSIKIPESISVNVHEEGPSSFHLVLPPTSELDMSELEPVHGGRSAGYGMSYG